MVRTQTNVIAKRTKQILHWMCAKANQRKTHHTHADDEGSWQKEKKNEYNNKH